MKKKISISIIDYIRIMFGAIPDKPNVRAYLDRLAEKQLDKQQVTGLIQTSNAISRER